MLDCYLPMLSPNESYNETGLTMQSAGPVRQPSQPIALEFLFKGSEFSTGESKADRMHSRSDIQALVKLMCLAYLLVMRTITKSAPLARVGSLLWLAQQTHQLMTEMTYKSCLDWS